MLPAGLEFDGMCGKYLDILHTKWGPMDRLFNGALSIDRLSNDFITKVLLWMHDQEIEQY